MTTGPVVGIDATPGAAGPHNGCVTEQQTGRRARRDELADFLQSRRARLNPREVGLVPGGRRRVPGLRREETALLAGISIDYYVRLEQGRAGRPSEEVLRAVATALRLDPAEEDHLFQLARPWPAADAATEPAAGIRSEIRTMLGALGATPAFVINGRMDVLAANPLATALILDCASGPATRANAASMIFLDPVAESYYLDWEDVALEAIGFLRVTAARTPGDTGLARLLDELGASPRFPELWSRHEVARKGHGSKRLVHPEVGELTVRYETLTLPADPDQTLVMYVAEPGSPTAAALRRLTHPAP